MTQTVTTGASRSGRRAGIPRIAVIGVHGYGALHVMRALELQAEGRARLVGLADPRVGPISREGVEVAPHLLPPQARSIDELLERTDIDIAIVATPLHTHAAIAGRALRAGADVLLEKPPVTDLATLAELEAAAASTAGLVQVGFQSLGSHALHELRRRIARGDLGTIESIGAIGSWTRDRGYWNRAPWAGHRDLDGIRIADGAVSNPFAHALMTALRIAGWDDADHIASVESDLRRVNAIQTDDTSSLRITPRPGRADYPGLVHCAFTLAGPREADPVVVVRGTEGRAVLSYTRDVLEEAPGLAEPLTYERDDLLRNLIDAGAGEGELISPLARTGAFVRVIDEVSRASVVPIDPAAVEWRGLGEAAHPVLRDAERAVRESVARQALFRELPDLAWA